MPRGLRTPLKSGVALTLPDIHDGSVVKIGRNCWAEFIHTPEKDGAPERKGIRLTDRFGRGVCIEGDEFDMMVRTLLAAIAE